MVLIGLGTVWILDGLEVTIVGALASTIVQFGSGISITTAQIGVAAGAATLVVEVRELKLACLGAHRGGYRLDIASTGVTPRPMRYQNRSPGHPRRGCVYSRRRHK
jgi:hypothetical protein